MKILFAALLLAFFATPASADDALQGKLTGIWWGHRKVTTNTHGAMWGWNLHWVIERTEDGRFRKQEFMVDPDLKVYCELPPGSGIGSWRVVGKDLLTHQFDEGSTGTDTVSIQEGKIRWKGSSMSGPVVVWECEEASVPKFKHHIDETYRRIALEEFQDGLRKKAEQSARALHSKPDGKTTTNPESDVKSQ